MSDDVKANIVQYNPFQCCGGVAVIRWNMPVSSLESMMRLWLVLTTLLTVAALDRQQPDISQQQQSLWDRKCTRFRAIGPTPNHSRMQENVRIDNMTCIVFVESLETGNQLWRTFVVGVGATILILS
eukprot:6275067-Amphidinium_carterae.1